MHEKELHLRDYYSIVWKRRYLLYTFFIIVMAIVMLITFTATPIYRSTTKLLIEKVEPLSLLNEAHLTSYDPQFIENQLELMKSRLVLEKVINKLTSNTTFLEYLEDGLGIRYQSILNSPDVDAVATARADNRIMGVIYRQTAINPVRGSQFVNISFESKNPEVARLVSDAFARSYLDAVLEIRINISKYVLSWMAVKVQEERVRLEESERGLQEYMRANDIVTLENRMTIIPEKLSELSRQLTRAETQREQQETLYKKARQLSKKLEGAEALSIIAADPTVRALREQEIKSEQELAELSKKFGKKHPIMIRAREDLAGQRSKKRQEIMRVIDSIKNEYEFAQANERVLRRNLEETKQEALSLNDRFIQYNVMKREVDSNKQLYDSLINKMKEQSITEGKQNINIAIVDKAQRPERPVKPNKFINIMMGLVVGAIGGIGIAFFAEYLDNTIKSPEDVDTRLGLPVLGIVQLLRDPTEKEDGTVSRIVLDDPRSVFAENFKILRTSVMLSSVDAPPKSVLITSMEPMAGKTTTAVNLAISLAQSHRKVLLIDSDMRRPSVHKVLGLKKDRGLSTLLAGTNADVIQEGPIEGLDIITSGPIPPDPSELLSSERLGTLLAEFGKTYDIIVIDSPPVLTVTDSLILRKEAERTIVVARVARTTYNSLERGVKFLEDIKPGALGVLVNCLDVTKDIYYKQKYYYYYYYSSDEEGEEDEKKDKKDKKDKK